MRLARLLLLITVTTMFLVAPAHAGDPGTAVFTFLKIGTDARSTAMGGAMTGLADGLGAATYNPASLALAAPREVTASYVNWVLDIQGGSLAGAWAVGEKGRLGISAQYLDYGNFDSRDAEGNTAPDFGASDLALGLSYAASFGQNISAGITGRFISESIDNESMTGMAADLGLLYEFSDQRTRFGAAVRNLGGQTKAYANGAKEDLPIVLAAGASHHLRGTPILASVEVLKPSDDDVGGAFGVEVAATRQFSLRGGFNTLAGKIKTGSNSDKLAGISIGAGFQTDRLGVDYAFATHSELGDAHRFTIHTRF
jgi:hypothetical protein